MAGSFGANLTELFQVLHGEIISEQVQQGILEHASMAVAVRELLAIRVIQIQLPEA